MDQQINRCTFLSVSSTLRVFQTNEGNQLSFVFYNKYEVSVRDIYRKKYSLISSVKLNCLYLEEQTSSNNNLQMNPLHCLDAYNYTVQMCFL